MCCCSFGCYSTLGYSSSLVYLSVCVCVVIVSVAFLAAIVGWQQNFNNYCHCRLHRCPPPLRPLPRLWLPQTFVTFHCWQPRVRLNLLNAWTTAHRLWKISSSNSSLRILLLFFISSAAHSLSVSIPPS